MKQLMQYFSLSVLALFAVSSVAQADLLFNEEWKRQQCERQIQATEKGVKMAEDRFNAGETTFTHVVFAKMRHHYSLYDCKKISKALYCPQARDWGSQLMQLLDQEERAGSMSKSLIRQMRYFKNSMVERQGC